MLRSLTGSIAHRADRRTPPGFTLVELLIVTVLGIVILSALGTYIASMFAASTESSVLLSLNQSASRIVDRIAEELRYARADSLVPANPANASSVTFQRVAGWDGSTAVAGTTSTLTFENGRITLNDNVIGDQISDLSFTRNGEILSYTVNLERGIAVNGQSQTFSERMVGQVRLQTPE